MKTKLAKIIERLIEMRDTHYDDEFSDELDNALIHLDSASDRLIALDEEEEEEEEEDNLSEVERIAAIELAEELLAAMEAPLHLCIACGKNPVDPDEGEDTCYACVQKI